MATPHVTGVTLTRLQMRKATRAQRRNIKFGNDLFRRIWCTHKMHVKSTVEETISLVRHAQKIVDKIDYLFRIMDPFQLFSCIILYINESLVPLRDSSSLRKGASVQILSHVDADTESIDRFRVCVYINLFKVFAKF